MSSRWAQYQRGLKRRRLANLDAMIRRRLKRLARSRAWITAPRAAELETWVAWETEIQTLETVAAGLRRELHGGNDAAS